MAPMGKVITDTADAVADAALAIGNCQVQPGSDADKRACAQLELPIRHGGMGLHRLSPAEGSAAFLSSAALANVAMIGAPEQFRPLHGPAGAGLRQEWSQLRTHVGSPTPVGRWLMMFACARSCRKPRQTPQEPPQAAACGQSLHSTTGAARSSVHSNTRRACSAGASRASSIWLTALPIHN